MMDFIEIKRKGIESHPCYPLGRVDEYHFDQMVDYSLESALPRNPVYVVEAKNGLEVLSGYESAQAYFVSYPQGSIKAFLVPEPEAPSVLLEKVPAELALKPMSLARFYLAVKGGFKLNGQDIANVIGGSRSSVNHTLRLLQLNPAVHEYVESGAISMNHAKHLRMAPFHKQLDFTMLVIKRAMSTRDLYKAINPSFSPKSELGNIKTIKKTADITRFEEVVTARLGLGTEFTPQGQNMAKTKWGMKVSFSSFEEFGRLLDLINSKVDSSQKIQGELALSDLSLAEIEKLLDKIL